MTTIDFNLTGRSLYVSVPSYSARTEASGFCAAAKLNQAGKPITVEMFPGCSSVNLVRNLTAGKFLASNHTDWLMIDDDIECTPDDIMKTWGLISIYNVVVGAYALRTINTESGNPAASVQPVYVDPFSNTILVDPLGMMLVHRAGAGWFGMTKEVLEKVLRQKELAGVGPTGKIFKKRNPRVWMKGHDFPFYKLFEDGITPIAENKFGYETEDFVLCDKIKDAGYPIWCPISLELTHAGLKPPLTNLLNVHKYLIMNTLPMGVQSNANAA